jgi:hypothetical protein
MTEYFSFLGDREGAMTEVESLSGGKTGRVSVVK